MGPLGILLGPLIGAVAGEMINNNSLKNSFKFALLNFRNTNWYCFKILLEYDLLYFLSKYFLGI